VSAASGVGVHTAEVVPMAGRLEGPGLDVVAAIASVAEPATVVVSDTVAGLVAGSGLNLVEWRQLPEIHLRPLHVMR
jgi:class 3 adenylate cyclase